MRRPALALAVVAPALALALGAGPAAAITNGSPDGGAHPNVGGLVADQPYSDGTWLYCSGTLISPTVFVTAAHCAEGGSDQVRVTFSSAYHDGDTVYAGTFHADPAYRAGAERPARRRRHRARQGRQGHRAGRPAPRRLARRPARHAAVHLRRLRRLRRGEGPGAGGHTFLYDDVRGVATGTLNAVNPAWLRISMNPSTGNGGTCYGDSGGPNFLGTSNVVAATTITGDSTCRSTNVDYRLDTPSARSFLTGYVHLP